MRFRLNKLVFGPVGGTHVERLERGNTWFNDDEINVEFLRGDLRFIKTNDNVLVSGHIETSTPVQCVRSLDIFSLPLTISLEDIPFSLPGMVTHAEAQEVTDARISHDGWIDLSETLRSEIILAIPMNPVSPNFVDEAGFLPEGLSKTDSEWLSVKWTRNNGINDE